MTAPLENADEALARKLADLAAYGEHNAAQYDIAPAKLTVVAGHPCGGLPARCPDCIALYRAHAGDIVPLCMVCEHRHWAYEDCIFWPVPGNE